jgi:sarcosine oxidase subunit delta
MVRPEPYPQLTDPQWGAYLFLRDNTKGWFRERWVHVHGCRQWFNLIRNTVSHQILLSYRMDEKPPQLPPAELP